MLSLSWNFWMTSTIFSNASFISSPVETYISAKFCLSSHKTLFGNLDWQQEFFHDLSPCNALKQSSQQKLMAELENSDIVSYDRQREVQSTFQINMSTFLWLVKIWISQLRDLSDFPTTDNDLMVRLCPETFVNKYRSNDRSKWLAIFLLYGSFFLRKYCIEQSLWEL